MASDSAKLSRQGADAPQKPRSAEEVRAEIERARRELATTASALRQEVAETTDWRAWVRRHPAPILVGALALGFWLGYRD